MSVTQSKSQRSRAPADLQTAKASVSRSSRRVDLSFLNEEEARQILQVLERDSQLKRTEKERLSKLHKKKEDGMGFPGATGEWFEDIQKRKFQNETDVSRMSKQPLAHWLKKAIGNDSANTKGSALQVPQAQKHSTTSILEGLRTPFASLFSSFRKSKRQLLKLPQKQQKQNSSRYDCFSPGALTSFSMEEVAKTQTCISSLTSESTSTCLDVNQADMLGDVSTWNEELENELLKVLDSLDDQLAQEQSQDAINRRTPTDYSSRVPEIYQHSIVTQPNFLGEMRRSNQNLFLSEGTRILRARDKYKTFYRPRRVYDTYTKHHHVENYTYGDIYGKRSSVLKRGYSTCSLGHSSEDSSELPSGSHSSGFGHKNFMPKDTMGRSYSLSSLTKHQSLMSADKFLTDSQQHSLKSNMDFTQTKSRHHPKRTPLSSIIWNMPQSSRHSHCPDRLLRTQSLMEFDPAFEDTHPCSPVDNTKYEFYRSKSRNVVPNKNNCLFADKYTDPLYFDNRENYLSHTLKTNISEPSYRYPSYHGNINLSPNNNGFGKTEEYLFRNSNYPPYNDVFHVPDVNFEKCPANLNDQQSDYAKKGNRWQTEFLQDPASDFPRSTDHPGRISNRLFLKPTEIRQRCPTYVSSALENQTEFARQSQSRFGGDGHTPSNTFVKSMQIRKNSKIPTMEEVRGASQSNRVDIRVMKEQKIGQASGQVNTINPAEYQMSPAAVPSPPTLPTSSPLKPPLLLNSKRQAKATSLRCTENMYLSRIHSRNSQSNENSHAESNSVYQTSPLQLSVDSTKTSIPEREDHRSETLKSCKPNKMLNRTYSSVFSGNPKVLSHNVLPCSRSEKFHKPNRFVRYSSSRSISGSSCNSSLKSPVMYYTLPRKSASIDGSDLTENVISQPTRKITFRSKRIVGDNLETSNRIRNDYSNKGDKTSFLSQSCSSLYTSSKEVANEKGKQIKDYHLWLTQVPKSSSGGTNINHSRMKKDGDIFGPEKTAITVPSEKEETDAGNPLKQYKTTSTLTVSIEEDNVKYHELISVYYTLPRKKSRTLCNLFLDDTKKNTDSSSSAEKSQSPQKEYEVRIGMATEAFPSSLEKGEKVDSPDKVSAYPHNQQDSKSSSDTNKGLQVPSPIVETADTSQAQCTTHNSEEAIGSTAEELTLAFSSKATSECSPGDSKLSVIDNETVNTVTNTFYDLHIGRNPSLGTEASKCDETVHLNSMDSLNTKIPLGNISAGGSANNVQTGIPFPCQPPAETTASIPPYGLNENIQDEKSTADPEVSTPVNADKLKIRNAAKVKESARYICRIISERGHGFHSRNENGRNEASDSKIKLQSDFQNSTPQVDAAFSVNPVIQTKDTELEYTKPQQQGFPQNSLLHEVCTNSQRSGRICMDNQNIHSKGQHSRAAQDLPEHSLPEKKLALDCTRDKISDLEKRKNRSSIKNRLAAMYKTSRKFSSKKNSSSKPHISYILSQNDAPLMDTSNHSMLVSPSVPQAFLQTGNENQTSLPDEFNTTRRNKQLQTNEESLLLTNEVRRPFTNLCNQEKENPEQSDKNKTSTQHSMVLHPNTVMPTQNVDFQTNGKVLQYNNHPTFSKCTVMDSFQKIKHDSNIGDPLSFPLSSDKHLYIKNDSNANIHPLQKLTSPAECDLCHDKKQSIMIKHENQPCIKPVLNLSKPQRERHFSECSYTQKLHHLPPKSNLMEPGYSRKFKSYSELPSCDENENWDTYNKSDRKLGSRHVMYPSIEFGIFGKEQQQAFLDNIKRSLTEGRLWSPCLLKNPTSIRKEDRYALSGPELLKSSSEHQSPDKPADFQEEASAYSSDSDSDTTTDDEYYLHEYEKESEL